VTKEELRAYNREYHRRWRRNNPEKVRAISRRSKERQKAKPTFQKASREWAREYARRRSKDPAWRTLKRKYSKRCYERARQNLAKVNKRRAEALASYYRCKGDPVRNARRLARIREWHRNRAKECPSFAIMRNLRSRLKACLKRSRAQKSDRTIEYVGCSLAELRRHLERQFKYGMTWANHGRVWHIDHIIPCAKFDLTDERQQRLCFHYLNLQPLRVEENLRKKDKLLAPAQLPLLLPAS
jgi:hypothetical protein